MKNIRIDYLKNRGLCRLSGDYLTEIREQFSVKNEGAFFMRKKGMRFVADRKYFITPTGMFEPGLFFDICKFISVSFTDVNLDIDKEIPKVVRPTVTGVDVYDDLSLKLRDFQSETIKNALSFGRGIIKIGTGGGKTLISASLLSTFYNYKSKKLKALMIVPDLSLVNQTHSDFLIYKVPFTVTRWTGNIEPDLSSDVIIANIGILQSKYAENLWINDVDLVIVDETHKLKGKNKICKLVDEIKTYHKFGLTGTLPDDRGEELNIISKLGTIIYEKSSFELREEKYLTQVSIKVLDIDYTTKVPQIPGTNKYKSELEYIYTNKFRNNIINTLCKNFNNNTLILVNHISHGQLIYDNLKSKLQDKIVYFIRGDVDVDERDRVIKEMEVKDNIICVAISAIFSTGINVKNIHMIVFGSGGKSFIRIIQSIGRGLRLHNNKQKLTIIDIVDNLKYGGAHGIHRKSIYDREKINYSSTKLVEKLIDQV
jgi:superfamily II DNA or RNA helicase